MQISRYTDSLQYNLEATARMLQEAISVRFKELNFGITYDEFIILDEIFHTPGILQIELAKKILKGRAHTGKFLTALENKGYIERKTAIKGKRQVVFENYITPEGEKVLNIGIDTVKNYVNQIPIINNNDMKSVIEFLQNLKSDVKNKFNVKFL